MTGPPGLALVVLCYVYPATVFVYYIVASLVSACTRQFFKKDTLPNKQPSQTNFRLVLLLCSACLMTYAAQLITIGVRSAIIRAWPREEHIIISYLSCILVFGIEISQLNNAENSVWYPFSGSWALAIAFEVAIFVLQVSDSSFKPHPDDVVQIALVAIRCLGMLSLVAWRIPFSWSSNTPAKPDVERQSLLPKPSTTRHGSPNGQSQHSEESGYGSTLQAEESSDETPEYSWERRQREAKEAMEKRLQEGGNWFEYAKGFKVGFPNQMAT